MASVKVGEPFGLDAGVVKNIDWGLALKRVINDLKSDFIFAPHLGYIYRAAGDELVNQVKAELNNGKFLPDLPLTIEVPKSFRIQVKVKPPRLGPPYSRPGSILYPKDRLLYQVFADEAAPFVEAKTDSTRTFSHRLDGPKSENMFKPTRVCWSELQQALAQYVQNPVFKYVLKIDVANYFGSINQHMLINTLGDAGYSTTLLARLEAMLTIVTGGRSSRSILQGVYPSDLWGNFYMEPIDRFLADLDIPSARYVDDMYIFIQSVDEAESLMRQLIPELRRYDLVLNEAKSVIMPKGSLNTDEPDLETLFSKAVAEISSQVDDADFSADYGFQTEWNDEEDDAADLELEATKVLFDAIPNYPGHEENIERFCLPLFAKANSDHALEHVMAAFEKRPSMSQIYASYLAKFVEFDEVNEFLIFSLKSPVLVDWQLMWVVAALQIRKNHTDEAMKAAVQILKSGNSHDALRAVVAVYIGRHGDLTRRNALKGIYGEVSPYVQAAIYFSSVYWKGPEKANAKAQWGNLTPLNQLLTVAMTKK